MKNFTEIYILLVSCILLFAGNSIQAFSYDYSATTKCLVEAETPQYGGGIIVNPEFNCGLEGWAVFGQGKTEERRSDRGNRFIVAYNRTQPLDSFSQKVHLEEGKLYAFSAWVQVSEGSETVTVVFRTHDDQLISGGIVAAKHGCWSMLKGGIVVNFSSPAELYFESKNTTVEIWVDNVSLQSFTKEQWRSHQDECIDKVRRRKVRVQVTDTNRAALAGATLSFKQTKTGFPLGCAMTKNVLTSTAYQNWFASRFTVTTFGNEMKWYSTEKHRGQENYSIPDAMVAFAKQNGISIRGHNIFWDNSKYQPWWVEYLPPEELRKASAQRIDSVVSRYAGQLIAWDVVNENLHFTFFEDKLGQNASASFFSRAYQLDPKTTLFMNEFNTLEYSKDTLASPEKYLQKLRQIQSFPGNEGMLAGIGLQSHFGSGQPNIPYMRASMDMLGATGLPLWLTEVDVAMDPNQVQYLEQILREGYSHPAVQGIIIWSGPQLDGCDRMCLTDNNYKNTPIGDVVDKLIDEWKSGTLVKTADSRGYFKISLFHGDYDVTVTHPATKNSASLSLKVAKEIPDKTVHLQIHA